MEKVADSAEWDDGPTFGAANPMVGALRGAAPRRASDSKPPELGASPPPPSFDVEDPQRRASAPERASDAEAPGLRRTSAPASTRAALSAPASTRVPEASRGDALRRDISALDREVQAVLSKRSPHKRQTVVGKAWHAAVTALVEREKEEIALRRLAEDGRQVLRHRLDHGRRRRVPRAPRPALLQDVLQARRQGALPGRRAGAVAAPRAREDARRTAWLSMCGVSYA